MHLDRESNDIQQKNAVKKAITSYNIFFKFERERIIDSLASIPAKEVRPLTTLDEDMVMAKCQEIIENYRYHERKERRRHRKTHGKIGFLDLSRAIAEKWKTVDPFIRSIFVYSARLDKNRFTEECRQWEMSLNNKKMGRQEQSGVKEKDVEKKSLERNDISKDEDKATVDCQKGHHPVLSSTPSSKLTTRLDDVPNKNSSIRKSPTVVTRGESKKHMPLFPQRINKERCMQWQTTVNDTSSSEESGDPSWRPPQEMMQELFQELNEIVDDESDLNDFLFKLASIE